MLRHGRFALAAVLVIGAGCTESGGGSATEGARGPTVVPLAPAASVAVVAGVVDAGDYLLDDGTRADLYSFAVQAPSTLVVQRAADDGGLAELHLFSGDCLSEPDVSRWGGCYLGLAEGTQAAVGDYVIAVRSALALPWAWEPYGFTVELFAGPQLAVGELDPDFGVAGAALSSPAAGNAVVDDSPKVALDSLGRVVLAWEESLPAGGTDGLIHLARFSTDGTLDAELDADGLVVAARTSPLIGVATTATGGIVVAENGALVQFTGAGALDTSFGSGGVADLSPFVASDFAEEPGGGYLLGASSTSGGAPLLRRVEALGTVDAAYAGAPPSSFLVGQYRASRTWPMQGGQALASVSMPDPSGDGTTLRYLARYDSAGLLDADFGTGGLVPDPNFMTLAASLDGEGNILTAETRGENRGGRMVRVPAYAKLTPGGEAVSLPVTHLAEGFDAIWFLDLDAAGRLLVVGTIAGQPLIARYWVDGVPDRTFGDAGRVSLGALGVVDASGMADLLDGSFVLAVRTATKVGVLRVR